MSKRNRRYDNKSKLLEGLPGSGMGIIDYAMLPKSKRQALEAGDTGKRCCCPPPQRNRLGGCQPGLTWANADRTALKAICRTCLKPLVSSQHRRRDQVHMIGLTKIPFDHIDMDDIRDWGVFVGEIEPNQQSTPIERGEEMNPELDRAKQQFILERVGGLP